MDVPTSSHCHLSVPSVCQKQSPCSGLLHTFPQRSKTCEQDLHFKLQQEDQHRQGALCLPAYLISLSPAWLCNTGDVSKCFPVPVISLDIPGASTRTGQAPLSPFSCKQCLGGQQISSKELHNIPPNATWLEDTFLRLCQGTQKLPQSRQEESLFFYFMKQQQRLWDLGRSQVIELIFIFPAFSSPHKMQEVKVEDFVLWSSPSKQTGFQLLPFSQMLGQVTSGWLDSTHLWQTCFWEVTAFAWPGKWGFPTLFFRNSQGK